MRTSVLLAVLTLLAAPGLARAETVELPAGEPIQAALDALDDGDVLLLAAGTYRGDLDFGGKTVTVRGVGPKTVLRGTGDGPVVRFDSGEGRDSVLDSVTVRGGRAARGGGIFIDGADPVVMRCYVTRNRASSQGSGIFVGGGSTAVLTNNLITYNRRDGAGDPHGIEIVDAAPIVMNNTVTRADSNGLILRGNSPAIVANNVFAWNGGRVGGRRRGRGICDFSGGRATIINNLFHRNRIAAILRSGVDYKRVASLEAAASDPLISGNIDGSPGLRRTPPRAARLARPNYFKLRPRSRARDAGSADPGCNDTDGTRNDIGHTGGPFATAGLVAFDDEVCTLLGDSN